MKFQAIYYEVENGDWELLAVVNKEQFPERMANLQVAFMENHNQICNYRFEEHTDVSMIPVTIKGEPVDEAES